MAKTQKTKRGRSIGARNKQRGNEYERRVCKELTDLGFECVTSRMESKSTDNNKVDVIDKSKKLPCQIQLKRTTSTPQYFSIRKETTVPNEEFVIIWNKQRKVNDRFLSDGEVVLMDKNLFYKLIAPYAK